MINEKLLSIQAELKAPKAQKNTFGNYNYRSCEDILEAVKPLLSKYECTLTISDKMVHFQSSDTQTSEITTDKNGKTSHYHSGGDRFYIKSAVRLRHKAETIEVNGYAREEENKKGMDSSQITGAASSYARKYALNGLFLIDDTKDSDFTNQPGKGSSRNTASTKTTTVTTNTAAVEKQIHTQKAIEDRVKAAGSVEMLTALWIECTLKQQQTDKIKGWFSIRKSQLKDENKSQTNFESDLFPDVIKVIKHINGIESEKHLNNWYKKHLADIQKLETRDYDLISKTIDNKKQSFNK